MKIRLALLLIIFSVLLDNIEAQNIDRKPLDAIKLMDTTGYPFFKSARSARVKRLIPFSEKYWGELPMYSYKDIGEMIKFKDKNWPVCFYRRFTPTNGTYYLVATICMNPDSEGGLLITYDTLGNVIDYIEPLVNFPGGCYIKHWSIDSTMQVITYHLKVNTPKPIIYFHDYDEVSGQRVDTYYQIDSLGKFHCVKEILYEPKKYAREYFNDEWRCVWDGDEKVIEK